MIESELRKKNLQRENSQIPNSPVDPLLEKNNIRQTFYWKGW